MTLTKDKRGIAYTLGNIANVYLYQGNYSLALEDARKCLALLEELNDEAAIAQAPNNIGSGSCSTDS